MYKIEKSLRRGENLGLAPTMCFPLAATYICLPTRGLEGLSRMVG
jgi:hypothetical protein